MTQSQLTALLETITGHLQPTSPEQERTLQQAQQRIATSLLQTEDTGSELLFGNSDFYARENINSNTLGRLSEVAKQAIQQTRDDGLRAYVRTVPVRSGQIAGSMPDWAIGAKAVESMGPFLNSEGRHVWVDVYKVVKLTTLYLGTQPVLLFNASVGGISPAVASNYTVAAGSVWINANLLSPEGPADRFVGMKVKSGSVKLSVAPTMQNGKITLNPATNIEVSVVPEQDADEGAAEVSNYGKDARESKYQLPLSWKFTWSGATKKVTAMSIGSATCEMYGQALTFTYDPVANPAIGYNPLLNVISIQWKASSPAFNISQSKSPFITLTGSAPILKSYWILPAAKLDVNNPLEAEGNGGVILECDKGLRASWTNLQNKDARLIRPFITGWPGNISVIDLVADTSGASQHFDLWKDDKHPYRSSTDLVFLKNAPFLLALSSAKSQEFLTTQCNSDFKIDRPVKANGEPFSIRSEASALMLAASETQKLIYLYDDNLLMDYLAKSASVKSLKPVAIALENALFTVSPVSTCMLFGECDEQWEKVSRANLFISFILLRYLPTLPDPYVGKLKIWERLFGQGDGNRPNTGRVNSFNMLLCAVRYSPVNNDRDNVTTGFYFGSFPEGLTDLPSEGNSRNVNTGRNPGEITREETNTGRTGSNQNLRTKSLRSQSSFKGATKVTTASLEKINTEKNLLLQSLNVRPGISEIVQAESPVLTTSATGDALQQQVREASRNHRYEDLWDDTLLGNRLNAEPFALLDVSSNANQLGISVSGDMIIVKTGTIAGGNDNRATVVSNAFPFIIEGMQVKAKGEMVRSFTLPQIAWEPVINLTPPDRSDPPASVKLPMDPEAGYLYYEDDGGPTRIWNNSTKPVALAPVPVVNALVEDFKSNPQNYTVSAFTLPFGLKAISYISKNFVEPIKPDITNLRPKFRQKPDGTFQFTGGIQLSFKAGDFGKPVPTPAEKDSPMFPGYIIQLNNLLDMAGQESKASNLGHRVTEIFNNEFLIGVLSTSNKLKDSRGVPVSRMDLTGYGANMFSDWLSPTAAMAQTSQAKFDVMMGRTAHEVIQVKSILYPWGIRVVRTITLFRSDTGYIYRTDSGWKAESDGKFDFSYRYLKKGKDPFDPNLTATDFETINEPFQFHPGVIKGLFNVRNIKDAPTVKEYTTINNIPKNTDYVNGIKGQMVTADKDIEEPVKCGGVYFDADVEIENVVQGHTNKRVVSKKILGYVQVAPAGKPLSDKQLKELLALQNNSIGGELDCVIDINKSDQQMRINRFDVNNSVDAGGNPVFVVAARGNVALPKAGSWSVVQHNAGTGDVIPLPDNVTVPLIRTGKWKKEVVIDPTVVTNQLLRIAHPAEVLRAASDKTINFGFLQITSTQKALFLTPAYGLAKKMLLSKTPPVFADAYRLMEGNSIFPNIGNAIDNFGKAMPMLNGKDSVGNTVKAFVTNTLEDGGTKVLELMEVQVKKAGDAIIDQGMNMLQKGANGVIDKALKFDVPSFEVPLVDTKPLRIYIEYKTGKKTDPPSNFVDSKLNFDVDSFSSELGNQWKSRLNNLAMVVDLGDMKRLMTIKGNFDANKGKETGYEGGDNSGTNGLPVPEIEFSEALQPVIDILEILAQLSAGEYGEAMKKGLKIAMSNSGEIWEYKFEATKEIPLVRFPPTAELYNSAQTPLKLEASLGLGVYFNAALKVTTEPGQLLPTAGAFLKFHGGLSVMCVSVGVGSIYAVGSVDVKIACDTKVGPNLTLAFGFGVQIVVSLPVVGHASVTYMIGIEMFADKDKVVITALMLFRGNAELLGGLVCVTITIEAKGIVVRENNETQASAQVTFALDISIFLVIDISFSKTWGEDRQIA